MNRRRTVSDTEINAYLDGELTGEDLFEFESLMSADTELRARVAAYRNTDKLLRDAVEPVLEEGIPPRLVETAFTREKYAHDWKTGWIPAAAVILFVLGAAAGWIGNGMTYSTTVIGEKMVDEAQRAHKLFVPEVRHPVEVGAAEYDHLVGWLSKRLDHKLKAPDFTREGFSLIGGRLLPSAGQAAAQFMYESRGGERVTFYVVGNPGATNTAFRLSENDSVATFYWLDQPLSYALSGNIDHNLLLDLANAAYNQLSSIDDAGTGS